MSDTNNQENNTTPDPITLILRAGKLKYTIEQTVSIVCSQCPEIDSKELLQHLKTSGTPEFQAYQNGQKIGMFDVESGLYDAAAGGDADAQKALQNLRDERTIGDAVKETFFPDPE